MTGLNVPAARAAMRAMWDAAGEHGPACPVAHETATTPTRTGAITVTGWCVHGHAVHVYTDSVL